MFCFVVIVSVHLRFKNNEQCKFKLELIFLAVYLTLLVRLGSTQSRHSFFEAQPLTGRSAVSASSVLLYTCMLLSFLIIDLVNLIVKN